MDIVESFIDECMEKTKDKITGKAVHIQIRFPTCQYPDFKLSCVNKLGITIVSNFIKCLSPYVTPDPECNGTENPECNGTENPECNGTENPECNGTENPKMYSATLTQMSRV